MSRDWFRRALLVTFVARHWRRRGGRRIFRGMLAKALLAIYAVVGLIVANSHHYFAHLNGGAKPIASAVIAVVLWPLLLLGLKLHIK